MYKLIVTFRESKNKWSSKWQQNMMRIKTNQKEGKIEKVQSGNRTGKIKNWINSNKWLKTVWALNKWIIGEYWTEGMKDIQKHWTNTSLWKMLLESPQSFQFDKYSTNQYFLKLCPVLSHTSAILHLAYGAVRIETFCSLAWHKSCFFLHLRHNSYWRIKNIHRH